MDTLGNSKDFDTRELLFLVAKFLEGSPCQEAAEVLKRELAKHRLLPTRKTWLGEEKQISYNEVDLRAGHAQSTTLPLLCSKLLSLLELEKHGCQSSAGQCSLLGSRVTAPLSSLDQHRGRSTFETSLQSAMNHGELTVGFREQPVANNCLLISARQISPSIPRSSLCGPNFYKGLKKHCSVLGHLAPVFCVLFDHTGERIITGADDHLIKIWSSRSGQLLSTLRGHSAEVCDLSLSCDNTMIASGSLDKSVRVWCAQTSSPVAVLIGHQSQVTSVQFSPSPNEEYRYLASTGKDGFLCFWQWLPDSGTYSTTPLKFMEKNRMGDQTLCSEFSSGGKYFVTGGTDRLLRVYSCSPGQPVLMTEVQAHTDRIMTVQFGRTGESLLATGSCDGTASIWKFAEEGWKCSSVLRIPDKEMSMLFYSNNKSGKSHQPQVTMVGWESTDRYLMTAFSPDCHIRVWCIRTGTLVRKLEYHTGEVFVLEPHPMDSRILLTAGHDGLIVLWDMLAGVRLNTFQLESQDPEDSNSVRCIFDCKFSPDGSMCAAADIHGYLTLFGFGSSESYKEAIIRCLAFVFAPPRSLLSDSLEHPTEQFFHTDYHPLIHDRNHYVVDENTQLPPHTLPPPYLVDIDGNPHPTYHQEAIIRLFRPVQLAGPVHSTEESEDYDEYMKKRIARLKERTRCTLSRAVRGVGAFERRSQANTDPQQSTSSSNTLQSNSNFLQATTNTPQATSVAHTSQVTSTSSTLQISNFSQDTNTNSNSLQISNFLQETNTSSNSLQKDTSASQVPSSTCINQPLSLPSEDKTMTSLPSSIVSGTTIGSSSHVITPANTHDDTADAGTDLEHQSSSAHYHFKVDTTIVNGNTSKQVGIEIEASQSSDVGSSGTLELMEDEDELMDTVNAAPDAASDIDGVEREAGVARDDDGVECEASVARNGVERVASVARDGAVSDGVEREDSVARDGVEREDSVARDGVEREASVARDGVEREASVARVGAVGDGVERVAGVAGRENIQAMLSSLVYSMGLGELENKEAISLWLNRTIIPRLDSAQQGTSLAKRWQLYEKEQTHYQDMQDKGRGVALPKVSVDSFLSQKGRSLRSGRTILSSPSPTTSPESSDASEGVMYAWGESSTDSGDVSDWTAEVTSVPLGRKRTRRQRRLITMSDDEESAEGNKDEEEVGDSPKLDQKNSNSASPPSKHKVSRKARSQGDYSKYSPPDWLKQTSLRLSPYLPQVGDIAVYCHQGHELYLNDVRSQNVYPCKNTKAPWQKYSLLPQELCQVTNVRFVVGPPTLCSITLALLSPTVCLVKGGASSSASNKIVFSFKYHDMDGVLDFLILDSIFKSSIAKNWEIGEAFQSLIDGSNWKGTVLERTPFSEELPNSYWQCYRVQWEDGVVDYLSPWDMHLVDANISAYIEQVLTTPSESLEQEWGGEGEQERILTGLEIVLGLDEAHMFREPVSLEAVPNYCTVVAFPTDLGTIRERQANHIYRRKTALLWEVVQMWRNAVSFNLQDSLIVNHCKILVHMLWKFINSPDMLEPMSCYEAHPVGEVGQEVVITPPLVKAEVLLPSHNPTIPQPSAHEASWFPKAQQLLDSLTTHHSGGPFLQPVDTTMYKDYVDFVKTPMDLSTAQDKLQSGQYSTPNDFVLDLRLIVKNAKTYNRKGSVVHKMAALLGDYFEQLVPSFLKEFPHVYGTRSRSTTMPVTLAGDTNLRSSCSSVSEIEIDHDSVASSNPTPLRTSCRLRAKRGRSSDSEVDVNGDQPEEEFYEDPPLARVTRTLSRPGVDNHGGYTLRTRNNSQRMAESDSDSAESVEESEDKSVASRQSEEEEAYLEDLDSEESHTRVKIASKRPRRSTRHPRKRAKIVESEEDSDEEPMTTISRSRSGRIVKHVMKFS